MKQLTTCLTVFASAMLTAQVSVANVQQKPVDPSKPIASLKNLSSVTTDLKDISALDTSTPNIESFTTTKGTKVLFVRTTELPIVDIRITFNAGAARDHMLDSTGKNRYQGTASLTAAMLAKGINKNPQGNISKELLADVNDNVDDDDLTSTQDTSEKVSSTKTNNIKTENEIAAELENYGLSFSSKAYKDMFVVSMRSLSADKYLQPATELMHDILTKSSFPEDVLKRVKAQAIIGLKQAAERPSSLANKAFFKHLYGKHPYALPSTGTLDTVPNITQNELKLFRDQFLVAKNASIAITGDLTKEQANQLAESITADMIIGQAAPKLPTPKKPKRTHVHVPFNSNQTTIIAGQLGIDRQDPKVYDLTVANDILGGGEFHAKLMHELREKRGLTYGAYSGFSPMQVTGPFTISFSTRNDKAKQALKVTKRTLKNYLINGATPAEITETKNSMVNKFPLGLATNKSINGWLGMMAFYNLPLDYMADYSLNIKTVTPYSVNRAFQDKVSTRNLVIVTVGPKKP